MDGLYASAVSRTKTNTPAKKKTGKKRAPKKSAPTGAKARVAAVKKILLAVEKKMGDENVKATLADYIRLIQLQKEMTPETLSEITVTWVEPKK